MVLLLPLSSPILPSGRRDGDGGRCEVILKSIMYSLYNKSTEKELLKKRERVSD